MVFVWSNLAKGDPLFTLIQVAINDLILILAFPLLSKILLGFNSIEYPVRYCFRFCNNLYFGTTFSSNIFKK